MTDNQNLDIFVFADRNIPVIPSNPCYKAVVMEGDRVETTMPVITCHKSRDPLLLMEHGYSEGARLHYIWRNYPLKDYVGTAHYRRFFEFFDDIPDMDEVFSQYDAVLPGFRLGRSMRDQYALAHSVDDYDTIIGIIHTYYPQYGPAAEEASRKEYIIPCNIFILKRELFCEWCEFVFGVLSIFDSIRGFRKDIDIYNYVVNRLPEYYDRKSSQQRSVSYQARIQAFLMERLSTIFFRARIKNPLTQKMYMTEVHDDYERKIYITDDEQ